jgi:hypothetical protein
MVELISKVAGGAVAAAAADARRPLEEGRGFEDILRDGDGRLDERFLCRYGLAVVLLRGRKFRRWGVVLSAQVFILLTIGEWGMVG